MKLKSAQELGTITKCGRFKKQTRKLENQKRRSVSDAKFIAITMSGNLMMNLKPCKFTLSTSSI
jgi:hypothetical protein